MIYIIDNGLDYSDHCISFVRVDGDDDRALIEAAVKAEAVVGGRPSVVAVVETVEWRAGEPETVAEYVRGGELAYSFADWNRSATENEQRVRAAVGGETADALKAMAKDD